jgi:FkbM family methyltransferase
MASINKSIVRNGMAEGLRLYWLQKTRGLSIQPRQYHHPITLRNNGFDHTVFKQIFINGEYDLNFSFTPQYIIDGGANIGLFSVLFANRFPQAFIVALEPEEANFKLVTTNTRFYSNVLPLQSAIWHKHTHLQVVTDNLNPWSFQVKETEKKDNSVMAYSITDIMKLYQWPVLDIVKLDVEGAEQAIFSENYNWLALTKMLIIELHENWLPGSSASFEKAIRQFNFDCYRLSENLIYTNRNPIVI